MRIALVNPISETPTSKRTAPHVQSNRQSIGVQLGRALELEGHDVTVFMAAPYAPSSADEGVGCVYYPIRLGSLVSPALAPVPKGLTRLIEHGRFDVVLASEVFQPSSVAACRGARRTGALFGVWQELGDYQRVGFTIPARVYYATIGRWLMSHTDFYLPRASRACEFLLRLGASTHQIGPELPNAADETVFWPELSDRERSLVVCPGSLVAQKNPMLVLGAFLDHVLPVVPEARLLFKGRGPLESRLVEQIALRDAQEWVTIDTTRSTHEDMAEIYRSAAVGVVASSGRGASLAPVEMALCGTRVVLSETLYHAQALASMGAGRPAPVTAVGIGEAIVEELLSTTSGGDRGRFVAAVADSFGLQGAAHRVSGFLSELTRGHEKTVSE